MQTDVHGSSHIYKIQANSIIIVLQQMSAHNSNSQTHQNSNTDLALQVPPCEDASLEVTSPRIQLIATNAIDEQIHSLSLSDQFEQDSTPFINTLTFTHNTLQNVENISNLEPLPDLSDLFIGLENAMEEFYQQSNRTNSILRLYINYFSEDLKMDTVVSKPKLKTRKVRCAGKQCSICFSRINRNSRIPYLKCRHNFHKKCLDQWVGRKPNCPLCRHEIESSE